MLVSCVEVKVARVCICFALYQKRAKWIAAFDFFSSGGCVGGFMGFTCAVTTEDCDWDSYYPPLELKKSHGYSCRLCKPIAHQIIKEDMIDTLPFVDNTDSSNMIAGTVGGAFGMIFGIAMTLIAVLVCKKCQGKTMKSGEERVFEST